MHSAQVHSDHRENPFARLGFSHGYRLEGDCARLNAQVDLTSSAGGLASSFALQLWACREPYRGGPIAGFKVAEAPIELTPDGVGSQHDTVAFARPPALEGDYSMVLVLAAGVQGSFAEVHDFANYPARQRFVVPQLAGSLRYAQQEDGSESIEVEGVSNPREADNVSGTLSLQLWACAEPYTGGELKGAMLGAHEIGQLAGQTSSAPIAFRSELALRDERAPFLVLALCEWTALGYLARDYRQLDVLPRAQPEQAKPVAVVPQHAPAAQRPALNSIGEEELAKLAGISRKLAAQVIKARPFRSFDQLLGQRGIGDKTVFRLRKLLTLD